jgi:hypothetical protein
MNEKEKENENDYLWDRSGRPDPEIQRLESMLSGFAHGARPSKKTASRRRLLLAGSIFLAAALTTLILWYLDQAQPTTDVKLLVVGEDRLLRQNEWFDATSESRELRLERSDTWLGEFTLDPGSRLQAREIRDDLAQLYLNRGRMKAFVYLDAHPRFVQTRTPATNCVDLGCEYTLTVDDAGDSVVEVTMGRVAFEDNGREVYVPHGATCWASKARGAGTPRYLDAPQPLVEALDAFDAAHDRNSQDRQRLCTQVLRAIPTGDLRHCLSVFHFLQDRDREVAAAARGWLATHVVPKSLQNDRDRMKQYLEDNYWWK